jgi:hypothetical protein
MANTYDIGDVVRISAAFTQNTVPIDPGAVTLTVEPPVGTSTTYTYPATMTKDSTGNYHVDLAITQRGTYQYRWTSTGGGAASEENWFQVRTQKVA